MPFNDLRKRQVNVKTISSVQDLSIARTLEVRGRPAVDGERVRLWQRWREFDERLDGFAARRPRETAVVVLEPARRLDEPLGSESLTQRPSRNKRAMAKARRPSAARKPPVPSDSHVEIDD